VILEWRWVVSCLPRSGIARSRSPSLNSRAILPLARKLAGMVTLGISYASRYGDMLCRPTGSSTPAGKKRTWTLRKLCEKGTWHYCKVGAWPGAVWGLEAGGMGVARRGRLVWFVGTAEQAHLGVSAPGLMGPALRVGMHSCAARGVDKLGVGQQGHKMYRRAWCGIFTRKHGWGMVPASPIGARCKCNSVVVPGKHSPWNLVLGVRVGFQREAACLECNGRLDLNQTFDIRKVMVLLPTVTD
jgi:hypothetical protein